MKVTTLDEAIIQDIGHAFGYYDYGAEHGLIEAFPRRDAVASFICGYVRMALQSGMLYSTGARSEGFAAYLLPGQKISLKAGLSLAKGLLGAMKPKDMVRFAGVMSKGGSGLRQRLDREKSPMSMWGWFACGKLIRGRAICAG